MSLDSEVSFEVDVELARSIATAYLQRRNRRIEEMRKKYVDRVFAAQSKRWFFKPKSREEVKESLINNDEWYSISLTGKYGADRMIDLMTVCAAAIHLGKNTITLSGDLAVEVSEEIVFSNPPLEFKQ